TAPSVILFLFPHSSPHLHLHSFPTRRSSDLYTVLQVERRGAHQYRARAQVGGRAVSRAGAEPGIEHDPEKWEPVFGKDHAQAKRDRKSTRLNSSHVSISYAVFCLKKKKKRH